MPYLVVHARNYRELVEIAKAVAEKHPGLEVNVVSDVGEEVIEKAVAIGMLHNHLLEYVASEEYRRSAEEAGKVCVELEKYGLKCVRKKNN